jgi:hypothetical protein
MIDKNEVTFSVTLGCDEALALAQFLKRVGWSQMRENAVHDEEAYLIRYALGEVQEALAGEGYAPR